MADPLPISYLNGAFVPLSEARISPLDRGFLYSDGVYELMPVYAGRPFRFEAHAARLTRSAAETILLRDGELMEASSSGVHVVLKGVIVSPPRTRRILPGTTRTAMEEVAASAGIPYEVASISEAQLRSADEIWLSAATREVQ